MFEPLLQTDCTVYSVEPKVYKVGDYTQLTFPDGTVDPRVWDKPDFKKLQAIRLSAEQK